MIGDDVELTVVRVEGDRVRLGFDAPKDIPIWRKEALPSQMTESKPLRGESDNSTILDLPYGGGL